MLSTIAWRNVRANPVRFLGTVLAVVLATTFLSAALTARDSLADALVTNTQSALGDVDLVVRPGPDAGQHGVGDDVRDELAGLDGVASVVGDTSAPVELPALGDASPMSFDAGASGQATGWIVVEDPLTPWHVVDGRLPTAAGEVALDTTSAQRRDLAPGGRVDIATATGPATVTIVGTTEFGEAAARGPADVLFSPADAQRVADVETTGWDRVLVAVEEGAAVDQVRSAAEGLFDARVEVLTGDEFREQAGGGGAGFATGLGIGLQAFAYLALVIGALIIFNTFTTVVAQRTREFALLRAIGTAAGQVRRAVLIEAVVVGLVASAIGAALGIGLVAVAIAAVPAIGNFATFAVGPLSVLQVVVSGLVVTVASAVIPALRASRTRPVEALREADPTIKPVSAWRTRIGVGLVALGVAALVYGSLQSAWWFLAGGATALFVGVLVAGPAFVATLARLLRRPLGRVAMSHELAVAEAERNSRRTAATANALVIGVFLVTFATAAGGAVRDFAVEQVEGLGGADLSVSSFTGSPIPPDAVEAVRDVDGLDRVVPINQTVGFTDIDAGFGGPMPAAATDLDNLDVLGLGVTEGTLEPGGMAVAAEFASGVGIGVGDTVTVDFVQGPEMVETGDSRTYEVVALTEISLETPPVVVDIDTVAKATGEDVSVIGLAARFDRGADQDAVRASVTEVTSGYAGVEVVDANTFVTLLRNFFNFVLSAVAVLLGVAVVVALFGILNTLVLAIAQRTRELGVLRAVGMTRRQLRRMVRTEALVTSIVGTVIGAVAGVGVAFAVTRVALEGAFTWPLAELAITLVLGVVTGVLASLFPAWRAARLDPLEAIATE